jgi:hypothetical protein
MDYTYLDYFNYYLKEFINELINTFPETRDAIIANYRSLLEGRDDKNDLYVKCYYTKINNFLEPITKKDITLFETPGKIFIEGVDFHFVWNSQHANETNRIAIWKYLQILMILGRKNIPNHKEIIDMLNKVSNGDIMVPAKVEKTLASDSKDDTEGNTGVFGLGDLASSLGGLGSLVSGLTGGGDGGGLGGLGDLMGGLTNMLSNPEFSNAMSQLSQSMTQGMTSSNTESNNESNNETVEGGENNEEGSVDGNSLPEMPQSNPQTSPLFNNPLFGELADEISKTFNFDEMEKEGKPANIAEALGKFMSGNNPQKLMGLVGKFGSKLQEEVKKGNVNPADLLSQTMGAAGGMQNLNNMMNNPQVKSRMANLQKQNSTRDRLRAKLDKKNNDKKE